MFVKGRLHIPCLNAWFVDAQSMLKTAGGHLYIDNSLGFRYWTSHCSMEYRAAIRWFMRKAYLLNQNNRMLK